MKGIAAGLLALSLSVVAPGVAAADTLIDAVARGDRTAVRELLRNHADVNRAQADGSTALVLAVERNDVELATLLVRAQANVNAANEYGATALSVAASNGSAASIALLLDAHADPNKALLSGETPLMTAVDAGNAEAARVLLAHGADVNAREARGGQTALMWAVANREPAIVKLLLDRGADPRARSKRGFTPLLFAAQQGDVESGRLLLQAGADVNDRSGSDRKTPLIVAAASGGNAFSALLLDKGADPDLADEGGFTALHYAALDERGADIVRTLLTHGARPNPRTTKDSREYVYAGVNLTGATPLFLAASRGNVEDVRALLAGGADPFMTTEKGTLPLHVASWGGSPYAGDWTEDEKKNLLEVTRLLVERGSDVNSTGEHGWTALHGAAYKGVDAVVQFLVDRGARLEVFDEYGQTPLSIANAVITPGSKDAYYQSSRVLRKSTSDLLLKLGARPLPESGVQIFDRFYKP
ncbi:MAG TPA: ankyrin repeat domain-containing protein [Vicinamibacterales bacterium]|jgi:ankyrin repeat protein|nr:ankyrin repeat domain-containing protein [Vicinamibacterales bacterium]